MAYQLTTATDHSDVVKKIVAFLLTVGWTQDYSAAWTSGWRAHVHKGGCYANFQSHPYNVQQSFNTTNYGGNGNAAYAWIDFYLGTGYSGASAYNAQAGGPVANGQAYTIGSAMVINAGNQTAMHLFSDATGDNIAVIVERTPGVFSHLVFGTGAGLTKHGNWNGSGAYWSANGYANYYWQSLTYPQVDPTQPFPNGVQAGWQGTNAFMRADVDAFVGKWLCMGSVAAGDKQGWTGKNFYSMWRSGSYGLAVPAGMPNYDFLAVRTPNNAIGQAILLPVRVWTVRDAGGLCPLATIPGIFYTTAVVNGYTPGSSYFIGADEYVLFPLFAVRKVS